MDQQTYEARVKAFMADMNSKGVPPEIAATALAGMEQADKSATAQGIAYKSDDAPLVFTAPDGTQFIISNGRFIALKAATEKAEEPMMEEEELVEEEMEAEPMEEEGGEYIGDMTPAEFWGQLQQYLAPVLKIQDMVKAMGDHMGELKTMYGGVATKSDEQDAAHLQEIAALKAEQEKLATRLAELTGDQPAVTMPADIEAAAKSTGPQVPPTHPAVPQYDPSRPFQGWAAQTWPQLYDPSAGLPPNRS